MDKINYQETFQATIKNSKRLFSSSELLATKRYYGVATSLCVLSAEEGIKALVLLIKVSGYTIEIPDFEKIFNSHAVKHTFIKAALNWRDSLLEMIDNVHKDFQKGINQRLKEKDKTIMELHRNFIKIQKQIKTPIKKPEMEKWLNTANTLKNNGLYVNLNGGFVLKPSNIKSKDYLLSKKYTESIIELVEVAYAILKFNQTTKN